MDRRELRLIAVVLASAVLSLAQACASTAQEPAPPRLGAGPVQATPVPGFVPPVFPPAAAAGLGQVLATLTPAAQLDASPTALPSPVPATPTPALVTEALPLTGTGNGLDALVGLAPLVALLLLAVPVLTGRKARGK